MYNCMEKTHKLAMLYYICYIFVVTIVFTSLFVSLVFSLYGDIETRRRTGPLFVTLTDKLGFTSHSNITALLGRLVEIDFGTFMPPDSPTSPDTPTAPNSKSDDFLGDLIRTDSVLEESIYTEMNVLAEAAGAEDTMQEEFGATSVELATITPAKWVKAVEDKVTKKLEKGERAKEEIQSVEPTTSPAKWIKAVEDKVTKEQADLPLPNLEEQQVSERLSKREAKQRLAELRDQRQAGTMGEEDYKAQKRVLLQATSSSPSPKHTKQPSDVIAL